MPPRLEKNLSLAENFRANIVDFIQGDLKNDSRFSSRWLHVRAREYRLRPKRALHFHLSFTFFASSKNHREQFGAFLHWPSGPDMPNDFNEFGPFVIHFEVSGLGQDNAWDDDAVLINIREVSKATNSSSDTGAPIGLIRLKECPLVMGKSGQRCVRAIPETPAIATHWKRDPLLLTRSQPFLVNAPDQAPDQVVEGASEAMHSLTEEETDFRSKDWGFSDIQRESSPRTRIGNSMRFALRMGVDIAPHGVLAWVNCGHQLTVEEFELLLSSE